MKKNGFTLIELLLYISIVAIMLLGISLTLSVLLQSKVKDQTVNEVEQQGTEILQQITQTIRNATAINSPSAGSSGATLSLNVTDTAKNPTIFALSGHTIIVSEAGGASVALNSSQIEASNLSFANLSSSSTPGSMRVQFDLSHINPDNKNPFKYLQTFYGTASLRK